MSLFVEEILDNYKSNKKIHSSFNKEEIKSIVFSSIDKINRFNGITKVPYNVSLHSIYVGNLAGDFYHIYQEGEYDPFIEKTINIIGYMHDMAECIIGDVVYPIKRKFMCEEYKKLEELEEQFILYLGNEIFEIPNFTENFNKYIDYVKRADKYMGIIELIGVSGDSKFKSSQFSTIFTNNELIDYQGSESLILKEAIESYLVECKKREKVLEYKI